MVKGTQRDSVQSDNIRSKGEAPFVTQKQDSRHVLPTRPFDSSDSEAEERMREEKGIHDNGSYVEYLMREVIPIDKITDADELDKYLGLVLHNYADRVFNSGQMNAVYKRMKHDMLPVSDEEYLAAADKIKSFVITDECQTILSGTGDIERIADPIERASKYIKIYNYIFNQDVTLPEGVSVNVFGGTSYTAELPDRRAELKSKLIDFNKAARTEGFSSSIDSVVEPLILKISSVSETELQEVSQHLLAFSQVIGRRDRREMKVAATSEEKVRVDSSVVVDEGERKSNTSIISTLHGKSEKNQTWMPGVGAYNSAVKESFGTTVEERGTTARKVKAFVRTLDSGGERNIQKIGHLMFVTEVDRNRATAFTAAMFLDEVDRTGVVDFNEFPMQMKGAVNAIREISKRHSRALPVTRRFDEGRSTKAKLEVEDFILKKEGALLVKWLASKGECGLVTIKEALECSTQTAAIIDKNISSPSDGFVDLRGIIIRCIKRTDVPIDFGEFKSWASENQIVEILKAEAKSGLEEKVRSGLGLIDREILESWYKIDASKVYYKGQSVAIHARGDVDLGVSIKERSTSDSSDEKPNKKIARTRSLSGSVGLASRIRDGFERQVIMQSRSLSAEPRIRSRAKRSNSKDSSDSSRPL